MFDFDRYLRSVRLEGVENFERYPFSLKVIKTLDELKFNNNVTFLVGENGSGKSTLLEAIAISYGFNPEGGGRNLSFSTEDSHSELSAYLKLTKGIKLPKDGFFLRAESFYNVASTIDRLDREADALGGLGRPIVESYGGLSLHKQSHGESFMTLMLKKFTGQGIYILDEPEAALSPQRQLAMLSRMHQLVEEGAQFIIATHSPILMAYPDALIYSVDKDLSLIDYEETEHFRVMHDFMTSKDKMLKHLLGE